MHQPTPPPPTCPFPDTKATYEMQQNHNWLEDGPDGSKLTLLATPIVGSNASTKKLKKMKTNLQKIMKSTSLLPDEVRQFQATTVTQLYAGDHGTTRLVVVCQIEEGIQDSKEAKSGAWGLGVGAGGGGGGKG